MAPPPHPWAGKSGEGPPIAPPNWKWRAGNRITDMYFYSPSGKQFRSRPELANYLQTLNNPPDASLFCWRVTDEVLKNGYIPQGDVMPTKPAPKRKAQNPDGGGNKRTKTGPLKPLLQPATSYVQPSTSYVRPSASAAQPTHGEPTALISSGLNFPKRAMTLSSPLSIEHRHVNGRDRKKGKRPRTSVPRSFKSILAGRSSFKWLYDSDTLENFLEEARRLKNKSAAEINEIRKVVLGRNLDMNNICKYPNCVIRIFVRLLRNEEAPASMGKVELADLCVTWKCKKRHYWCLLEVGRVRSPPAKCSKVGDVKRGGGLGQNRGSAGLGSATQLIGKVSDQHHAVDGRGRGNPNSWLNPSGGSPKLDFRLADGSGIIAEQRAWSAEPTVEFHTQSSPSLRNESECSMPSRGSDAQVAAARRSDGLVGVSLEDPEASSGAPVSSLNCGDGVARTPAHSESALEAVEAVDGLLHGEDAPRSEGLVLRLDNCISALAHDNEGLPQALKGTMRSGREPASKEFRLNLKHSDTPTVSQDNASLSEAISDLPRGKTQPAYRGNICRREEAVEVMLQNNPEAMSASEPSSDLYGESIIVITGFKSSASKGVGSVYQSDEAPQVNGGNCVTGGHPFVGSSEPATTNNGSRFTEMYDRSSLSAGDAVDSRQPRKNGSDLSSKGGGFSRGFCGTIKSEAIESALPRGEDKRSEQFRSNFKDVGIVTITNEPDSISKGIQGTLERKGQCKLQILASALHDGGGISQEDVSATLFSSDGIRPCMVRDVQTPVAPVHFNDVSFASKSRALVLPATVKHEALVPYEEDTSPIPDYKRHTTIVPENDRKMEEYLSNGRHLEYFPSTPKHFGTGNNSFACWCKICGSDMSFCRGCMCSFCRKTLQQGEDWTVVKCICDHVCHIDCALAANAAGVVKELGLDGELSCPSCSRKVDLWPFFQKRFDLMLSLSEVANVNLKGLEKLLLQALQLLKGTEKSRYKSLEGLVIESYELTRNFPVLVLVQQLLRAVQDELHTPQSDPESMEDGLRTSTTPEQIKKEQLARESLDNAKMERLMMEQVVDKVHKAYEDALSKRRQARTTPRLAIGEPELVKEKANPPVTKELITSKQAKVDEEMQKLWDMRKFDTRDLTTLSGLDASAKAWLESLKSQRVVVEAAQGELKQLEILI